ncbi:sodium-dependent neutral amino acid transporter B(0)AT3-like isoform X2 [Hydractinia symbiolongicarpus]|nr:sodium-dependent neutral amino acid transporter B(0)AT3-like isoform X2 [Hydractinia symbiolongicarpus]XP_057312122.1 sodium-dependent neutral amino acid transporter B(0)AT3-like isoform X2 [Hydractinia symbiolongicarpus]
MSRSMSGYTSGSSRGPSTISGRPPSYDEVQRERLRSQKLSEDSLPETRQMNMDGMGYAFSSKALPPHAAPSIISRTSVTSEPLKITGLEFAFTSNNLPRIGIDETDTLNGMANDMHPTGLDRYKPPIVPDTAALAADEKRGMWGRKAEFILASVGLAVGLGNVWRFPYLCQRNGGGAFLIPYFIMMVIEGIPLFYIEFAVGQRFRRSAIGCWSKMHPALKGIGISCMVISTMLCIYYVAVIAWSFYYLFASLTSKLPWRIEKCPRYDEYNVLDQLCKKNSSDTYHCEMKTNFTECCVHDPQLYYFYRKTLDVSTSIGDSGSGINWKLAGCLVLAWVVVYACVINGVKSSGKAVYFTATFPYVILSILFILGLSLDGASIGLKALFKPDFKKLRDPQIWMDAASQMFFTLSLGFGALISFASYMPIKNNCVRDAYTVVFINCGTSLFAGIVVFSILGHREYVTKLPVTEVGGGAGLAFITFCDAFLQMPVSPLWSVLFFIMLILLGIDSEFGTLEGLVAPFYDAKWVTMKKWKFTGILAFAMFLIGLALITSPGYYAFQLFDDFAVPLPLLFIAFFQVVSISWVYGNDKFANDIEYMTGKRPYLFWMICWKYISPLAIFIIFVANCHKLATKFPTYKAYVGCLQQMVNFSSLSPGTKTSLFDSPYPAWGQFFIVAFITISMIPTIAWLIMNFVKNPQKWVDGFKSKLSNIHEYYPDPSYPDPSRRKSGREIETQILKEIEEEED